MVSPLNQAVMESGQSVRHVVTCLRSWGGLCDRHASRYQPAGGESSRIHTGFPLLKAFGSTQAPSPNLWPLRSELACDLGYGRHTLWCRRGQDSRCLARLRDEACSIDSSRNSMSKTIPSGARFRQPCDEWNAM